MTSQRFLNDKAIRKDFVRSLLRTWVYPTIAFVVLCMFYLSPTISYVKEKLGSAEGIEWLNTHNVISFFGVGEYFGELLPLCTTGMVACGILIALTQFSFAFRKNSVNVYFSMGITRTRLYLNRFFAGIVQLFTASFLPYLIIFIINVAVFGFNKHQLALMLYFTSAMFISGASGLAVGSFASSVAGSMAEAVITSVTSSTIVSMFLSQAMYLKTELLKGYVEIANASQTSLLGKIQSFCSPWSFVMNIGKSEKQVYDNFGMIMAPIVKFGKEVVGEKLPVEMVISKGYIIPIAAWVVISCAIMFVGLYLFNKRKNENSNSFGKFLVSAIINGLFVLELYVSSTAGTLTELYNYSDSVFTHNAILCLGLFIVGCFIAFFLAMLIIRRNAKSAVKLLPIAGVVAVVCSIITIYIGTGYFGTYNKLPEINEIKGVSMRVNDARGVFDYSPVTGYNAQLGSNHKFLCQSEEKADIELFIKLFNEAKDTKYFRDNEYYGARRGIEFIVETKDGEIMARSFNVTDDDFISKYNEAVFNSTYFDKVLAMALSPDRPDYESTDYMDYMSQSYYYGEDGFSTSGRINELYYFGATLLADGSTQHIVNGSEDFHSVNYGAEKIETDVELLKALYNDLSKMTYNELYKNNTRPLGALSFDSIEARNNENGYEINWDFISSSYNYDENNPNKVIPKTYTPHRAIALYPEMKETLAYLEGTGVKPSTSSAKPVKVVYADEKCRLEEAVAKILKKDDNLGWVNPYNDTFVSYFEPDIFEIPVDTTLANIPKKGTFMDYVDIVYSHADVQTVTLTDANKAEKIANTMLPVYDTHNDNGRFVIVVYNDNTVILGYVPNALLSVLK